MSWKRVVVLSSLLVSALAVAQPVPPAPPPPGGMRGPGMGGPGMGGPGPGRGPMGPGGHFRAPGIPPQVARRLGIAPETVKKVQDASFEANEQLIGLEADLKRAQLALEKTLAQPTVDEGQVMAKLEAVTKAELAVRKNRMGLMLKIRKLLGQETWDKLQGELPGPGDDVMGGGREVRVVRHEDGTETYDVME